MSEVKACPKCGSTSIQRYGVKHTKRHGDKQRFSCNVCHSIFYNPKTAYVAVDASKFDALARPYPTGNQ
jgi:transposase-like protein